MMEVDVVVRDILDADVLLLQRRFLVLCVRGGHGVVRGGGEEQMEWQWLGRGVYSCFKFSPRQMEADGSFCRISSGWRASAQWRYAYSLCRADEQRSVVEKGFAKKRKA